MTKARVNADNVTADIAGITAGTGITGGGTSGTVTITNDMATTIAAAGDLIYGTANDAYTRLGLGTAGRVLKVNSGATAPEWAVDPTTDVVTTAGDLIYGTGADAVTRLGIGTASQYLRVNSGATAPEWATLSAGGMTLISETTANNISSLSLSSIPQTYKQLVLTWSGIVHSNDSSGFQMRFNNNANSVYYVGRNAGRGGIFSNQTSSSTAADSDVDYASFGMRVVFANGPSGYARGYLVIDNYASTTTFKTYTMDNAFLNNSNGGTTANSICTFASTSAITSIDIFRGFGGGTFSNEANSSIRLYGVS